MTSTSSTVLPESLRHKQSRFVRLLARLFDKATELGYELTLAEAYRPPELAELYASQGRGIRNSLHCMRLAIDLNVFRGVDLLTRGEQFQDLGIYWESLAPDCRWGGRFRDGNHFSIEHQGVK